MFDLVDPALETFRREAAAWIRENFPKSLADKNAQRFLTDGAYADADPDFRLWLKRVVEKGWGAPTWPREYGGADMPAAQAAALLDEYARAGAFNPNRSYGEMMLGPTLLEYGDEEQKRRFIPPIARGEVRWCQGFSEPGAGSDLASLQTKCVDGGDHWLVNGQKIWTSGANHADWCFCLVRTDTSVKHGGISFLLIDMKSEGVLARPIELISGTTHFCEVFFTNVRVPKENMVGGVNRGWPIAKRLLQFERDSLASSRADVESLAGIAKRYVGVDEQGRLADKDLRTRIVGNDMRARAYAQTLRRSVQDTRANEPVSASISILKNLGAEISQQRAELMVEIMGHAGLGWEGDAYSEEEREAARGWLHSKAFSIYGGSHEIQNNLTAKRVLGLPSED